MVAALATALSGTTAPMTIRNARNSLSEVLHGARNGNLQLIGKDDAPEDMTLVLSVETFAEILLKVRKPVSFGEALYASGFRPATGARPRLRAPSSQSAESDHAHVRWLRGYPLLACHLNGRRCPRRKRTSLLRPLVCAARSSGPFVV